ncbi:hypothetical protein DL764_010818 [Monosporascus ibericus]|uniref:Major facilitator superfamily (MFS) profile domain-containing protein n=1 Tax=Monosporascus ibericus TaxID=155417 RepID=A0A4Q4STF1_9PEZI|nr:hypothetical protein DL764_010818 [Monosporascus ibericus]
MASSAPLDNGALSAIPKSHSQEAGLEELPLEEPSSETSGSDNDEPGYSVFTAWEKRGIVLGAALGALFSPLSAQIYLPALQAVASDLDVSISEINLTITTYMVFQGITPMVIGSFADSAGRRPAYCICFIVYILANIGCALSPNYEALLVLRMLQSAGASSTIVLCQAVVADIVTSAERGSYVAYTSLPGLLGPCIGPVVGGVLAQYLGWRWIFWLLAILAIAVFAASAAFLPETCRYIVGDGSVLPPPAYRTLWQLWKDSSARRRKGSPARSDGGEGGDDGSPARKPSSLPRKEKFNVFRSLVLLFEAEMSLLLAYGAVVYAGVYAAMASMGTQLQAVYGLSQANVGLLYLPISGGMLVSAVVMGRALDWNYRRHRRRHDLSGGGDFPIERARLEVGAPLVALSCVAIATWGWALQSGAPLAVTCVLLALLGFGVIGFNNALLALITDLNPGHAAAAAASNNITRCLVGAVATAVIDPLISAAGLGWAFVLFGALFAVLSPSMWLVMRNGARWRMAKAERRRLRRERRASGGDGKIGPQET